MVSKEDTKCIVVSNSDESDCETAQSHSFNAESGTESGKPQVKKRNKALQVRFTDICEAQNEFRRRRSRSISCKVTHRKYMTMPARRSIPNVTKSTGVQTSPDLTKRYKTFPFDRKKGHTFKHAALVENYKGQNNGFLSDIKTTEDGQTVDFSSSKRQLASERKIKGSGPVAWNSLTHVESLGSPSVSCKRKKSGQLSEPHSSASSKLQQTGQGGEGFPAGNAGAARGKTGGTASGDSDIKAQLQAMETLINSSQETIKVLLGVIQELEKGEAQREGRGILLIHNGDNRKLDFTLEKMYEDKLQPMMKRLCPMDSQQCPALPYSNEVFTSTPKRKSKSESKKHARWKLWFL
uniref:Inhibitory synaptic factor 2A n=1 Tax=Neogobius melanostomus TaxID=47308 RepID=A0A8C6S4D9_9GOBI